MKTKALAHSQTLDTLLHRFYTLNMTTRDKARLLKIDEQLIELASEINSIVYMEENGLASRYFRRSKALRLKYAKLEKMRSNLMRSVSQRADKAQSYSEILAARKEEAAFAADRVAQTKISLESQAAAFLAFPSAERLEQINILRAHLKSLEIIARNKERAVENWLAKSELDIVIPRSREMRSGYGKFKEELKEKIIRRDIENNVKFEQKTPEDILGTNSNWNMKVSNNATFDLITPPVLSDEKDQK